MECAPHSGEGSREPGPPKVEGHSANIEHGSSVSWPDAQKGRPSRLPCRTRGLRSAARVGQDDRAQGAEGGIKPLAAWLWDGGDRRFVRAFYGERGAVGWMSSQSADWDSPREGPACLPPPAIRSNRRLERLSNRHLDRRAGLPERPPEPPDTAGA